MVSPIAAALIARRGRLPRLADDAKVSTAIVNLRARDHTRPQEEGCGREGCGELLMVEAQFTSLASNGAMKKNTTNTMRYQRNPIVRVRGLQSR
jgi:hypothetical protein